MSFYAANDRIHVTDAAGKTIFDTNKPMPHMLQQVDVSTSVTFPNVGVSYWTNDYVVQPQSVHCARQEYVYSCQQEYVCGYETQCGWVNNQYVCEQVYVCSWQNVCKDRLTTVYYDLWRRDQGFDYAALEWETTHVLANITGGVEADFLLVKCSVSRTAAGQIAGDIGTIPCGVPTGVWMVANGSSILENACTLNNGQPSMTRLMSVFVENGQIKVTFKHSSRAFRVYTRWQGDACAYSNFPTFVGGIPQSPPPTASSYQFTFSILVGKFTI